MKFILTLYICSIVGNNCMYVPTEMHEYQNTHDTFSGCIKDGLGESFELFFNGDILKLDQIDKSQLYPKFMSEPFAPEAAEET